jgi:hypothetical protein
MRCWETSSSCHSRLVRIAISRSNFLSPFSCKIVSLYLSLFRRHYCRNQSVRPQSCVASIINMAGRTAEIELKCTWPSFLIRRVGWDWIHWVHRSVVRAPDDRWMWSSLWDENWEGKPTLLGENLSPCLCFVSFYIFIEQACSYDIPKSTLNVFRRDISFIIKFVLYNMRQVGYRL